MIVTIANLCIKSSIIFGFLANIFSRQKLYFLIQTQLIIVTSLLLLFAFVTSDFSVQNVLFYSSSLEPMIYKISGLWANHNSSLLFWTTLLAVITMIVVMKEDDLIALNIITKIFSIMLSIMMVWIYFTSNPFVLVESPPKEGLGLNPVLQDIALSIHPPILYLGYVTYIVPFAYSIVILITQSLRIDYLKTSLFFSKIAFCALTCGISLGSSWAYRELGWGGYWFFDPVENISLMPWLVGIAFHHSIITSIANKHLIKTSIFLGMLNFIIILFGMMLVRSGSLVSVHAFASNIKGGIYVVLLFTVSVCALAILYFVQIKKIKIFCKNAEAQTKNIIYGVLFSLLAAISVLIGIIYPNLYEIITGNNISIDSGYFYAVFLPISILVVILCVISSFQGNNGAFSLSFYNKKTAMVVSHLGILILTIGVLLNGFLKKDIEFIGQIGDKIEQHGYVITLQNIGYALGPNYYRQIAEFWVRENNHTIILKPENRLYKIEEKISAESDIYSFISKDLYAVLGRVEENNNLYANIYIRPWMGLIWLGMFLTASGILISIISNKKLNIC